MNRIGSSVEGAHALSKVIKPCILERRVSLEKKISNTIFGTKIEDMYLHVHEWEYMLTKSE